MAEPVNHVPTFFLQWKNTDACFDFYCPCHPEEPQHFDGHFGGTFTCGNNDTTRDWEDEVHGPQPEWCGRTWELGHTYSEGIKEVTQSLKE